MTYQDGTRIANKECYNCKVIESQKIIEDEFTKSNKMIIKDTKKGPGEMIQRPIYQVIKNKLLNQMIGQIKVLHKCHENQIQQCVYLEDLEKHIENKCQGFEVECFACQEIIKTFNGIKKHIKYTCKKLKINCFYCSKWYARDQFKIESQHQCMVALN